jgi:diaminohydroxyphosphoribosylaminopyrimidine deaminase/5-amino-6-(5-phosphoribosylamino)uracil reductase
MVGAVVIHGNTIIGEGYTSAYGGNHAEVNAINAVNDKALLKTATLYVTLEPCSHFGKTPPCSDLIITHKIPKVVIGCIDDNHEVAGKGIAKLKAAGCNVTVGVLETECKAHHKRFFTFHNKKRPYVILKWAESADGFISPNRDISSKDTMASSKERLLRHVKSVPRNDAKPVWITNPYSRQLVHKWRAEEQAILVGTNTVIQDNPSLTVRDWTGQNPVRVVLDRHLKLSQDYAIFDDKAKTIVFTENKAENSQQSQQRHLEIINWDLSNSIAQQICDSLFKQSIQSIIIEGGKQTLQTFIDEHLWDEARVFIGTNQFNQGVVAPNFSGTLESTRTISSDTLSIYKN